MDDTLARFGAALREWRVRRHLTQEQLAERSGLSYKFIGEVERGRGNPTLATMAKLASALDVGLGALVDTDERAPGGRDEYRISKRDLQAVREAVESIGSLVDTIATPPYAATRRRRR